MTPKVLIGFDASERSGDALALGADLCAALGASPVLVTVRPGYGYLPSEKTLRDISREQTERWFADARQTPGLEGAETRLVFDDSSARGLTTVAEEIDPVAVVVASARHGAIGRIVLGSVGSALLSGAGHPIAVAPVGYAEREGGLGRIGVAVDGGGESWAALAGAISLAERTHGRLTVLTAVEPPDFGYAEALEVITLEQYESAERKRKRDVLERAVAQVPADLSVEPRLLTGRPGHVLAEAAEDLDLLVVGSRGYGPVRRVLLGSVAARLVHRAPCALIVLPRGAGTDPFGLESERKGATSSAAA